MATVVALLSYLIKDIFVDFVSLTGHDFDYALALSTGLSWVSAAGSFGASPVEVLVYRVGLNLSLITGADPY